MKSLWGALSLVTAIGALQAGCSGCSTSNAAATPTATPVPAATFPGYRNIEKAQKDAASGQLATSVDLLAEGLRELDEAAPLRIVTLKVVQSGVQGYGLYTEVPANALSISKKDPLNLYFEPAGFARKNVNGVWTSDMVADVSLYAPAVSPQPFVQQPNFVGASVTSRRPNRELYYLATLHVTGVPAGDYVAEITLRDKIGGETAKQTVVFKLVP